LHNAKLHKYVRKNGMVDKNTYQKMYHVTKIRTKKWNG
jgi:ribosomal protein L19E